MPIIAKGKNPKFLGYNTPKDSSSEAKLNFRESFRNFSSEIINLTLDVGIYICYTRLSFIEFIIRKI